MTITSMPTLSTSTLLATLLLPILTSSIPFKRSSRLTASSILAISPTTASCATAPFPSECRTASQAAPYVALSFTNFNISTFGEQAALLADMLYESSNFQYAINHYPGIPGQGTRMMMSPTYVAEYADYLSNICMNCGTSAAELEGAKAEGPAAVLRLVNTDEWGFGAAAWFLMAQCSKEVRQGLAAGTQEGWEAFLSGCLGVTSELEERNQVWREVMDLKGW